MKIAMLMLLGLFGGNDGDEALLGMLEVKGSDLSKPHEIDFFLYFRFGGYARLAAKLITPAGFRTEITKLDNAGWHKWDLQATKTMIPKSWTLRDFVLCSASLLRWGWENMTAGKPAW